MSQEASTHLITEPSEDLITSEPWSIETYADGLIDDLFADIDYMLDGRQNLSSYVQPREYIPLQTVTIPQFTEIIQPTQTVSVKKNHLSTITDNNQNIRKTVTKKVKKPSKTNWFGKIFGVGAVAGVAIAGFMCLLNSGLLGRLNTRIAQQSIKLSQPQPYSPTQAEIQADFAEYILGALSVIDRQATKSDLKSVKPLLTAQVAPNLPTYTSAVPTAKTPLGSLPPVLASGGTTPAPVRSTTVVERIYIPVYQAPLPMRYAPPAIGGVPSPLPSVALGRKLSPVKTALNTVRKAAKPENFKALAFMRMPKIQPLTVKTAPIAVRQPPKPILPSLPVLPFRAAPPKLPVAKAPAPVPAEVPPPPPKQEVAAVSSHELQGLLDLPGKSAALFNVEGITRRVDVGESIGSSGWTLVEVTKDEAIVRRNGEVRSIYAGQKF
jgi:hypothetical protein